MRVLDGAGRIAWVAGAKAAEPLHLLWALSIDETRASELLAQFGINAETIASSFLFAPRVDDSLDPPPVPIPLSPQLSAIVSEARELARQLGVDDGGDRAPAVGTGHCRCDDCGILQPLWTQCPCAPRAIDSASRHHGTTDCSRVRHPLDRVGGIRPDGHAANARCGCESRS